MFIWSQKHYNSGYKSKQKTYKVLLSKTKKQSQGSLWKRGKEVGKERICSTKLTNFL